MSYETRKSDTHEERYVHTPVSGMKTFMATVFCRKEESGMWYMATAYCSRNDRALFTRKKGRGVARRKYFTRRNQSGLHVPLPGGFDPGIVARIAQLEAP